MKDYQKHLEKLRADAAECALIDESSFDLKVPVVGDCRHHPMWVVAHFSLFFQRGTLS